MPGPEHPPSPDYVPGLEYPEYVAPSDDEVPTEDQPLPADASPITLSPGYDEEEHLAPADSTTLPAIDLFPSVEDTKAFETDEFSSTPPSPPTHTSPTYAEAPLGYRATMIRSRVASPPPFLLTPLSSPLPWIPLPPLPLPSPPLPLPAPSSPLLLPATNQREDVGESSAVAIARQPGLDVTHATDYSFVDIMDATPARPMSREVGYRITDVWDDMVGDMEERAPTTLEELSQRVIDLAATLALDTHEIYSEARHARQAWSQDMDYNRAVHAELLVYPAEVRTWHEQISVLQRQRIKDNDRLTRHIQQGHDRTREPDPARDPEP
nr:hypothetical protein [Tanacetum cinerariifolium]